ncbi:hypothetical protein [Kitasatospora sp. DSM 101779]|uniref:hypothetical protein n=1 Tax=Kitasatospora sp. DSM 101779 TaxID=2853165 RepID=UPI0021DA971E|nr:hypothetical protein [Kitasatospora sp. DSM 101779]MCU7825289.1 hypothetical protein [Kitasatospora sp. DSM 101779]
MLLIDVHRAGRHHPGAQPGRIVGLLVEALLSAGRVRVVAGTGEDTPAPPSGWEVLPVPPGGDGPCPEPRPYDPAELPRLIEQPAFLARTPREDLLDAMAVCWPAGVPAGTLAEDIHHLERLGVEPGPADTDEWISWLHLHLHLLLTGRGHPERALELVAPGGTYLIDDLLPLPDWPAEHTAAVRRIVGHLTEHPALRTVRLAWSTGLLMAVRTA